MKNKKGYPNPHKMFECTEVLTQRQFSKHLTSLQQIYIYFTYSKGINAYSFKHKVEVLWTEIL
jgi:hypothetical protein